MTLFIVVECYSSRQFISVVFPSVFTVYTAYGELTSSLYHSLANLLPEKSASTVKRHA